MRVCGQLWLERRASGVGLLAQRRNLFVEIEPICTKHPTAFGGKG